MIVDRRLTNDQADRLFHALADSTRRDIVRRVLCTEYSVSDLARGYPMSFASVQKHVAVLERAELVRKRRRGREQLVSANLDAIATAHGLLDDLEAQWRQRMSRFDAILEAPGTGAPVVSVPPAEGRTP